MTPRATGMRRLVWLKYMMAVMLVAITLFVRFALASWIGSDRPALVLFEVPIVISAYLGGMGPGLLATLLISISVPYLVLPPVLSFQVARSIDGLQWSIMAGCGTLISIMSGMLYRSRQSSEASERLLATTIASIGEGTITTDVQGKITFLNLEAERLTGWSCKEAVGHLLVHVFRISNKKSGEPREEWVKNLLCLNCQQKIFGHYLLVGRNGRETLIDLCCSPIRSVDGMSYGAVIVFSDRSIQNQAEQALRESEERLRLALNAAQAGVWSWNIATGEVAWSPENYHLYGVAPAHGPLAYSDWERCLHPDDLDRTNRAIRDVVEKRKREYRAEFRVGHPQFGERWLLGVGRLEHTPDGTAQRLFGINLDITEHKRMDEALRQSEEHFRSYFDLGLIGMAITSLDKRWLQYNDKICEILGYSREELAGLSWAEITHPDDLATDTAQFDRLLAGEINSYSLDKRFIGKEGSIIHAIISVSGIRRSDGSVDHAVGILQDITERKLAEYEIRKARDELELRVKERTAELESANEKLRAVPSRLIQVQEEERKRLASELHDSIGQTLAAIKFNIELVLVARNRGNPGEALTLLEQFVPTLQHLIEETRAIYTGLRPKMLEEMGLVATIRWFCREFMNLYPRHHVELEMDVDEEEIPEGLKIVIFRISQEALNNISKHSKAEWVDLSLKRNGNGIELTISDDGVGMDLDSILNNPNATSLGLTSMKERAELTGGVFHLKSMLGEGTTIYASWPIESEFGHRTRIQDVA